jgi:hypothetical protein
MRKYPPPKQGQHTGWSPDRDRAAQARFRALLMHRAKGVCEHPGCTTPTDRLQAHHDRAGYDAAAGRLLCHHHHKAADPHAR